MVGLPARSAGRLGGLCSGLVGLPVATYHGTGVASATAGRHATLLAFGN